MIQSIGFFTNVVTDMDRARKFYEGVLGLKPTKVSDSGRWTEYDIGSATLALGLGDGEKFAPSSSGASIALEVVDLEKAVAHLKTHGVTFAIEVFETPVCHTGVFVDPDGNQIMVHKRHNFSEPGREALKPAAPGVVAGGVPEPVSEQKIDGPVTLKESSFGVSEVAFVGYAVTDVAKARAFYEETLGLTNSMAHEMSPGRWWIEYNIGDQTLALASLGDEWKPSALGSAVAFEVDDFDATIADLKAKQAPFVLDPMDCGPCHMAGITDPDGSKIIIHKLKAKAA